MISLLAGQPRDYDRGRLTADHIDDGPDHEEELARADDVGRDVTELYGPRSIKRPRRSRSEIDAIREAIVDTLSEHCPMTVRQVFYALTVRGVIEKTEAEYKKTVVRLLDEMRWSGEIGWDDISDATRWMHKPRSYASVEDAISQTAKFYRRNLWADNHEYVEIWCEKEALAGVIAEVTYEFDVPLMVSRGFSSSSYLRRAAAKITNIDKPTFIYHFGDHDPSGLWIRQQIERDLQRHLNDIGEFDLDDFLFERIAVTPKQIVQWSLPTRPTKTEAEGNRHAKNFDGDSVELDAIPIDHLHALVKEVIYRHINPDKLRILRIAEESERALLQGLGRGS
jgi:hypothetical protein